MNIQMINTQINNILRISVWGIFPIAFLGSFLLCVVLVKIMKRDKDSILDELYVEKEPYKPEKLFYTTGIWGQIYFLIVATFAIIPAISGLNMKYAAYVARHIGDVEKINNIVIGLTSMAVTMAVVIIAIDKKYYIVFSIREVLQQYKFPECLWILSISCLIELGSSLSLLDNYIDSSFDYIRFLIVEITTLYVFLCTAYTFFLLINIMFMNHTQELALLKKIYKRFWLYQIDMQPFKDQGNWDLQAVETNIDYLLEDYRKKCRKKKISRIHKIEFGTALGEQQDKWCKYARNCAIKMVLFLLAISTIIDILVLRESAQFLCAINVAVTLVACSIFCQKKKAIQLSLLLFYADTWGYFISTENGKEKMIPRVPIVKNGVYNKYIMSMNSLIAFFYIWINCTNVKYENVKFAFVKVIQKISRWKNQDTIIYFPVFIIGYFLFDKGVEVDELRKIYNKYIIRKSENDEFARMLDGQILYLTKNFYEEKLGYRSTFNKYMEWLQMKYV